MPVQRRRKSTEWKTRRLSLAAIFERAHFDWQRLVVTQEGGVILEHEYPLSAKSFLSFAREDMKAERPRGLINALSNAKRAIDCKTDSYLSALGFSPKTLGKQIGPAVVASLAQFSPELDRPLKFRVLESLGIVTTAIVNRVRKIRHMLEHEYKKPSPASVRDAIDIASLYVSALQGSMSSFLEDVHIEYGEVAHPYDGRPVAERSVTIQLINWRRRPLYMEVSFLDFGKREEARLNVLPNDSNYLSLLRVLYAARARENVEAALRFAAMNSGFNIASKKIRIIDWQLG
jgi:hypothetical protein